MGRDKNPKVLKPNKYGDTNTEIRVRTSDLLVMKEAMMFYRKFLKQQLKEQEFGTQDYYVIDDLLATNNYIIQRIDLRYDYDHRTLEPADKEFYARLRRIYRKVRK